MDKHPNEVALTFGFSVAVLDFELQRDDTYSVAVLPMYQYVFSQPIVDWHKIRPAWVQAMLSLGAERDARMVRMVCISTNELENVFLLSPGSLEDLVRTGFDETLVRHEASSDIQNPLRTVKLLGEMLDVSHLPSRQCAVGRGPDLVCIFMLIVCFSTGTRVHWALHERCSAALPHRRHPRDPSAVADVKSDRGPEPLAYFDPRWEASSAGGVC